MSGAAMNWAMTAGAPRCASPNQLLVLLRIAHHADKYGEGCYASQQTLADETHLSRATVKRAIDDLKGLGLIKPGDPERAAHIRADKRPEVWDVPTGAARPAGGQDDPPSDTGGQDDPPQGDVNDLTGGQRIFPRGVSVTPKPGKREPGKPPPPPTPSPAADPSDGQTAEEAEEAAPDEPHPDAIAIIDEVDLGGHTLDLAQRAEAERTLAAKLAEGWTRDALRDAFKGCTINAPNPVGVFMYRLRNKLNRSPAAAANSKARASPQPGCDACERGLIEQPDRTVTRCHNCHPDHQGAAA